MALDYWSGCVNFRDVGEFVNLIAGKPILPEGRLLRGGSIDYVKNREDIGCPGTIINLRNSADPNYIDADYFHFPMSDKYEKYDTSLKEVRMWLNDIVSLFEDPRLKYPVLIHCLSGKDRTGIVIAALLSVLGIDQKIIIEEYLLSEGDVDADRIGLSLEHMMDTAKYFKKIDLQKVRNNLTNRVYLSFT